MARIDGPDRQHVLYLNNMAARQRRLFETVSSEEARGVYRALLNLTLHDLDRAVDAAIRRAA